MPVTNKLMKTFQKIACAVLAVTFTAAPIIGFAADEKKAVKPFTLKNCPVSDEAIDDKGDMKPHVFTYEGREIKLCCKGCLKDFNKEPAKYVKKIEAAEKAAK